MYALSPGLALTWLVLGTAAARLIFAASLGLGIDESYMVAAGRQLELSYFDHPPISWWLAWVMMAVTGADGPVIVRLPFIALFAVSTVLLHRLTWRLFGLRAAWFAAVIFNLVPVLSITSGSWVLPDGPMLASLLGAAVCLVAALRSDARSDDGGTAAWRWWIATGACAGLAMASKYSAVLVIAGAGLYLLTEPSSRRWLARPHPYVAGLVAFLAFSPVLIWNAQHGWISFLFQGGRAAGRFHPFGPITSLAGEALFLLPWIWVGMMAVAIRAFRRGPDDRPRWLMLCLAAPPIVLFTVVSLWSRVLFHWAAPGYLFLLPLLGDAVAQRWDTSQSLRRLLIGTSVLVLAGCAVTASAVRLNWLPDSVRRFTNGADPTLDAVDWNSLRTDLAERGLLGRPHTAIAATRWFDCGKIGYALGGQAPVLCLTDDPRQFGQSTNLADYAGWDVVIVVPHSKPDEILARFGSRFDRIAPLPPSMVVHDGEPVLPLPLFLGNGLHRPE